MPGEKHAGPTTSGPVHHRQTRGVLHGAVERRLRLPEPRQVSLDAFKHTRSRMTMLKFTQVLKRKQHPS